MPSAPSAPTALPYRIWATATGRQNKRRWIEWRLLLTQASRQNGRSLTLLRRHLWAFADFDAMPTHAKRPDVFEARVRQPLLRALREGATMADHKTAQDYIQHLDEQKAMRHETMTLSRLGSKPGDVVRPIGPDAHNAYAMEMNPIIVTGNEDFHSGHYEMLFSAPYAKVERMSDDLVTRLDNARCEGIEEMCWEAADRIAAAQARIAELEMNCRSYQAMTADAIHRMDAAIARAEAAEAKVRRFEEYRPRLIEALVNRYSDNGKELALVVVKLTNAMRERGK